ncbi:MAG TPA: 2-amino-4-hydroxy-6-hydroxymethyldihydropteridine diphosphokinase [Persephonella sp.]|uniref:2-amino-4-hydroxy-6-hydroxymethyldihydropteridine pyrophosphokinase n=1 Tax=Persephonella marina (strain DSM 14350 / EX-H1) TaxID=123214 RepID=C0QSX2_PERMH|nr:MULTISPECIES: 2-amino-4-hydroxy-6-hydroxymethyldihydropteridine diphosphokinase [Persephonella]ACO04140.1 2-amino-4-hydroxy-6-hydroxymethyldihydropteridine pyrophosphokinase [Persephonella marina EX-H1]HCB70592.1 2-amino-4-hydroxy-6-hydroxymethyldihydropteridine diphosphokinase [Persephonella sp.]
MRIKRIFLGLGSNIGDRKGNILKAVRMIGEKVKIEKIGGIYISKAVGFEDQPDFYNTAISGFTDLPPEELFLFLKEIEKKVGRIERFRWGPREIDIDILFYGDEIIEKRELTIPHPRLHERDFVLKPLIDIDPDFVHPIFNKSLRDIYEDLKERSVIGKIL